MTGHRYIVPGAFSTAFTPIPAKAAPLTGMAYKMNVAGQPGTQGIPAPYPAGVGRDIDQFREGAPQDSQYAGPVWYPSQYYETSPAAGYPGPMFGGARPWSDNQLPIPSTDPTRGSYRYSSAPVMVHADMAVTQGAPVRYGSQQQVSQPRAVSRWPKWPGK